MTQYSRPIADLAAGLWTTAPLWSKLNEEPYDDVTQIQLNNQTANMCDIDLGTITDPVSSINHILRIRSKKAGSGTITCTAVLKCGTTTIRSNALTLGTGYAETTITLTGAEADAITNYGDLHVTLTGTCAASTRFVYVSWIRFEAPDVSQNITETLNLAKFHGTTSDMSLIVVDSVSLSRSVGAGGVELGNLQEVLTHTRIDGIGVLDQTNEKDILNLAIFLGLSTDGVRVIQNIDETVTLDKFSGLSIDGYRLIEESISLSRSMGVDLVELEIINDILNLAIFLGLSTDGVRVIQNIDETVTLDKFSGLSIDGYRLTEESISLSRSLGEGRLELGNLKDILNLGQIITIIPLDQINDNDILNLGRIATIAQADQTNEKDTLLLGRVSVVTPMSQTNEKDGVVLTRSSEITISEHQTVTSENVTLDRFVRLIISEEAQGELNEGVILSRLNGMSIGVQSILNEIANFSQLYGIEIDSRQYLYENINLEYTNGFSINDIRNVFEAITLSRIDTITTLTLLILLNSINLERWNSITTEPPSLYVFTNGDHAVAVLFRDKRLGVLFRDKRIPVPWRDKRADK